MPSRRLILAAAPAILAGCSLVAPGPALLRPSDCFGDVPYAFTGWTSLSDLHLPREGPPDGRVYAMVTRDEVVLTVSPPAADASTVSVVGRGVCWSWATADSVHKAAFGETRMRPDP